MQVDKIVLTLRYSRELVDGALRQAQDVAWKSIEVGAEAVPSEEQSWQEQQRELYADLAGQLKVLFGENASKFPQQDSKKGGKAESGD